MPPEKTASKPLLPLIVERVWDGGFSLSDFWKKEYKKIRHYPLAEILEACELLVARGLIKQKEDGAYVPRDLKENPHL